MKYSRFSPVLDGCDDIIADGYRMSEPSNSLEEANIQALDQKIEEAADKISDETLEILKKQLESI